ncbi:MAG: hypothetical protein AAFR59_18545, partial [Bacteroidota bacterium]
MVTQIDIQRDQASFQLLGKEIHGRHNLSPPREASLYWSQIRHARFWEGKRHEAQGRLGAYIHPTSSQGFIGWYACDEDEVLSSALLQAAIDWLRSEGVTHIWGPLNGSTWYNYRFNLSGEPSSFQGEPIHPSYYLAQWKAAGFTESVHYHSTAIALAFSNGITELSLRNILAPKQIDLLPLTSQTYQQYKPTILDLLNLSFEKNPFFQKFDLHDFSYLYDPVIERLPLGYSFLLLDTQQAPIGLYVAYPAASRDSQQLIIKTVAAHPAWRNQQISSLVVRHLHYLGHKAGMSHAIHALMYAENVSYKASNRKFPSNTIRTYALLEKRLKD